MSNTNLTLEILNHVDLRLKALDEYVSAISPNDPKAQEKALIVAAGFVELRLISNLIKEGLTR